MSTNYKWAINQIKLQRAIAKAKDKTNEDEVKALYVEIGGLLAPNGVKEQTDKALEKIVEETPATEALKEVATVSTGRKQGRPKKNA